MADTFHIDIAAWLADEFHCAEEAATMANLRINVGDCIATRVEDARAKATRTSIQVSAYPLALWLASNWWRLRWESRPFNIDTDWRLTHVMSAAGSGYVWPPLVIQSDGDGLHLDLRRTASSRVSDLRFIEPFKCYVSGQDFEFAVSDFVERVIERLSAVQVHDTDLHKVWASILAERADPALTWPRKLEATLGFDPEDGDQSLILTLVNIAAEHGEGVAEELTAAMRDSAAVTADQLAALLAQTHETWTPDQAGLALDPVILGEDRPYEAGYRKAMELRARYSRSLDPLSNEDLADLFGLNAALFTSNENSSPVGVSERTGPEKHILLKARGAINRRFEVSRLAADQLFVANDDHWSLATASHTARQQFQRAFAAEFLCPVRGIKQRVGNDASIDEVEDIAAAFGVSPFTVQRQMVNAGLLSATSLGLN